MKAIELNNISVRFLLFREKITSFKEYLVKFLKGGIHYDELWALQDISLSVEKGESVGIIGRNGAGKTTLLKVISGILKPIKGTVRVNGKVVPLLELGAGFDPELTGLENIFLNGAIMGFSKKEMMKKVKRIVEFAELENFLDVPVKNYSSGMFMRLAFSIAIDVEPEILLVDEVLAVGDVGFQKKCLAKLEEFRKKNVTLIYVSHSLDSVKEMCERVVWLEKGRIKMEGKPDVVVKEYMKSFEGDSFMSSVNP